MAHARSRQRSHHEQSIFDLPEQSDETYARIREGVSSQNGLFGSCQMTKTRRGWCLLSCFRRDPSEGEVELGADWPIIWIVVSRN
jgi:hypothetical protein